MVSKEDKKNIWTALIILGVLFLYFNPLNLDFLGALVPGYDSIFFTSVDKGSECCEENQIIDGLGGGMSVANTFGNPAAWMIKVDNQVTACAWPNVNTDDDVICNGLQQMTRDEYIASGLSCGVDGVVCHVDPGNYPECWASPCHRAAGNRLFEPFPLVKGENVISGEFRLKYSCVGDQCLSSPYTFSGSLNVEGPVSCVDDPTICPGDSECKDGVCVETIILNCEDTGCPSDAECVGGVCVIEGNVITCLDDPSICVDSECSEEGVCVTMETVIETQWETEYVEVDGEDADADLEMQGEGDASILYLIGGLAGAVAVRFLL